MEQIKGHHCLTVGCSAHNESTSFSFLSISYQTGWTLIAALWMDGKQVYRGSLIFCCMCHTCFSVKPQTAAVHFFHTLSKGPNLTTTFPICCLMNRAADDHKPSGESSMMNISLYFILNPVLSNSFSIFCLG